MERSGAQAPSPLRVGTALGAVLLAAVAVFSLGVMVGKRVTESVQPAPPAALPVEPVARPAGPSPPAGAAVSPERLTFYDRLSGRTPPEPVTIPTGQAPQPGPAAAASAAPSAAPVPAPAGPAASPAPSVPEDPVARIRQLSGTGRFAVQVAAVNQRAAAEETAARYRHQGFDVTTETAVVKGRTWYRVRVGPFPDQGAAAEAAGIFRSALGLNAIVAQPQR